MEMPIMSREFVHCVGYRFVQHYYTRLNQNPLLMHKLYSDNFSFLLKGLDGPDQSTHSVIGQRNIHENIMQQNFIDCHTRIRHVDSQKIFENGVFIQTIGELSNDGNPMRHFTQTLILEQPSPNKFFVTNDMLHFLDKIFEDIDETVTDSNLEDTPQKEDSKIVNQDCIEHENEIFGIGSVYINETVNHHESSLFELESTKSYKEDDLGSKNVFGVKTIGEGRGFEKIVQETIKNVVSDKKDDSEELEPSSNALNNQKSSDSLAIQYATSPVSKIGCQLDKLTIHHKRDHSRYTFAQAPKNKSRSPAFDQDDTSASRTHLHFRGGDEEHSLPDNGESSKQRKTRHVLYPDAHQLFVGNIINTITPEDLKTYFSRFGQILEIRLTKQIPRTRSTFGFIVFDDNISVMKVLNAQPIYLNNHWLKVDLINPRRPHSTNKDLEPKNQPPGRITPTRRAG